MSESETGAPLGDVVVCWPLDNCAVTGADGTYQLTAPSPVRPGAYRTEIYPFAFRDGFEIRSAVVAVNGERLPWSTTLQRTIDVEAGRTVRGTIFRGEGSGLVWEGGCEPCKTLYVNVPGTSGTLVVRLAPGSEPGLQIEVPYPAFRPDEGSLPVTTEGRILVLVKTTVAPATFELSTTFTPAS